MRRRSRTRCVLKWAGTLFCLLIIGLWLASGWYRPYCTVYFRDGQHELYLSLLHGHIHAYHAVLSPPWLPNWARRSHCGLRPGGANPRFWDSPALSWRSSSTRRGYHRQLNGPIWLPLLIVAIPTGFLWWVVDRPYPKGHCQNCGYNLTGNVSGRCPECGTAVGDDKATDADA